MTKRNSSWFDWGMKRAALAGLFILPLYSLEATSLHTLEPQEDKEVLLNGKIRGAFLSASSSELDKILRDEDVRKHLHKLGDKPRPTTFTWEDEEVSTGGVYRVVLRSDSNCLDIFLVTNQTTIKVINLEPGRAYEWRVARLRPRAALSNIAHFKTGAIWPRLLYIPGVVNARDLGGRTTQDGRRIRMGKLYRSGAFNVSSRAVGGWMLDSKFEVGANLITPVGVRIVQDDLHVKTDLDLRSDLECALLKSSPLGTDVRWVHIRVRAYEWIREDMAAVAAVFHTLAQAENYPIALHCAAGRDRTGTIAFLIGGLLGLSEEDLYRDWAASILASDDLAISPNLFHGLVQMMKNYAGATLQGQIESFILACGVSKGEIEILRGILLEESEAKR